MKGIRLAQLAFSTMTKPRPVLRGVVFDMDGTLTVPNIDFATMYNRCNVDRSQDILEAVAEMQPEEAARANGIIEEIEENARETLQLMPGTLDLIRWLSVHGIPMALVTRNTKKTADRFFELVEAHDRTLPKFDPVITRDAPDDLPPKPDPSALKFIASSWGLSLSQSIVMVGDSPSNDIAFGKAAGVSTALLDTGRSRTESNDNDAGADLCVGHLASLARQLWLNFDVAGRLGTYQPLHQYPIPKPSRAASRAAVDGDITSLESMGIDELIEKDESGNTPIIWASDSGNFDVVAFLLKKSQILDDPKTQLNAQGYLGATAVMRAARKGHADIVKLLIESGADLDIPNNKLQYPLHFAAFKEETEAVALLLKAGANTRSLDRKGRTPAEDTTNEEIRDLILAAM